MNLRFLFLAAAGALLSGCTLGFEAVAFGGLISGNLPSAGRRGNRLWA